jgi:hypothetical protein
MFCSGTCLESPRKITKNLSQYSRSLGRHLNPGPPEYEAGVLTAGPQRSVENQERLTTVGDATIHTGTPVQPIR